MNKLNDQYELTQVQVAELIFMNNEPVAWMRINKQWRKEVSWVEKEGFKIPLYTHPAKTLSKKYILELAKEFDIWLGDDDIKFIQFVLRKAQE